MRLKKFLLVAALLAVPITVWAAQNIRQLEHGGAVWVNSRDSTTVPVGDTGIVVAMTNLVTASTKYVLAPKSGYITAVYSVLQGTITGNSTITVAHNRTGAFSATHHSLTLTASSSAAGDLDTSTVTPRDSIRVEKGNVIAIVGDGGSSASVDGTIFTVIIE